MHEVTPELIASIATRLYQQVPSDGPVHLSGQTPPGELPAVSPSLAAVMPAAPLSAVPQAPAISPTVGTFSAPAVLQASSMTQQPSALRTHSVPLGGVRQQLSVLPPGTSLAGHAPQFPGALSASTKLGDLTAEAQLPAARVMGPGLPNSSQTEPAGEPRSLANSESGLRQFVQRIRRVHAGREAGLCEDDPALQELRRRFSERGAAVENPAGFDVAAVRRDFPVLQQLVHGKPLIWMDNAATTQKPRSVIQALSQFYERDNSNIHRGAHTLAARATDAYEGARQKVQRFLGAASPEEILYVRGTTEGINLIAQTWGRRFLQAGDEIVLSTLEHHANIVPWQMVAQESGAVLRVIPVNDRGEILLEEYERLLGPRTRLVALTQASNSLGTILPVAEMTQMAKRHGARVLIDGAQSVAHIPVNVQLLDCDFFVFSGHKIFGPTGIGAVWARRDVLQSMPPWQGGGNMIRDVTFEQTTYHDPPARFEAGTPNIADAVGLGVALDYVSQLGLARIAQYEHELLQYATQQLASIDGLTLVGTAREKVGVLSFVLAGRSVEEVGRGLDREGIAVRAGHHCAQPSLRRFGLEATVRPSLSIYNTFAEIDRLAAAIRQIQRG